MTPGQPSRAACDYAALYCEENVWHLAQRADLDDREKWVAIITNPSRTCAIWAQRSAPAPEQAVVWDYHVVLIAAEADGPVVYDLDSALLFPTPVRQYTDRAFRPVPPRYTPWFRVLEAEHYCAAFTSDRSHMRDPQGRWLAPPPHWPPIEPAGGSLTLSVLLDLEAGPGDVLTFNRFVRRFAPR